MATEVRAVKKSNNQKEFDPIESGIDEEKLDMLFHMMYNRQMIWINRFVKKQSAPWTNDEILSKYKFCNLYREHDRSCQWEIRNIIMDENLSIDNLVWKIMVYRTFNNPETFARALDIWPNGIPDYENYDEDEFAKYISSLAEQDINPFTNAYSISGNISKGIPMIDQYTHVVIPAIHSVIPTLISLVNYATSPEQIISFLMTLPGASNFISHEYYQDFTYIPIYTDKVFMKFDQNDYTNKGPGSIQGAKLIFPNLKSSEYVSCWKYLQNIAAERLQEIGLIEGETAIFTSWNKNEKCYELTDSYNLSLNQIEGALCEFSKYYRLLTNTGNPRCPEFKPKTMNGIIVEREDYYDQTEFITNLDSQKKRGRGRPRKEEGAPKMVYNTSKNRPDFTMTLNLNLNIFSHDNELS